MVLLIFEAGQGRQDLDAANLQLRTLRARIGTAEATDDLARDLVAENARARALVSYLGEKSLPMAGMVRTLRGLYATLPEPLWVKQVDLVGASGRGGGPAVKVIGQGMELHGVDVGQVYEQFSTDFRAHPLVPDDDRLKAEILPLGSGAAMEFSITIDYRPKPVEGR